MCALPAMMGMLGGKVAGKAGALAGGGLMGLAAHSLTKKKKPEPKSTAQTFYGSTAGG